MRVKDFSILLVDDDIIDRELFVEALGKTLIRCSVEQASGGDEALDYLINTPKHPKIIVLDLNMPLKDGRETLKEIKAHKDLKYIPVMILSTSSSHFDVQQSYESGASLFMEKPHDFDKLTEMVNNLFSLAVNYVSFVAKQ